MLRVFPHNWTDFTSNGLAVLNNATNVKVTKEINGDYSLTFDLNADDGKWQYINYNALILCEGQLFRVYKKNQKKDGSLTRTAECVHVSTSDLSAELIVNIPDLINKTPREIITAVLTSGKFHIMSDAEVAALGMSWVSEATDFLSASKLSGIDFIKKLLEILKKGELYIDNYKIAIVNRIGRDTGLILSMANNLKSIEEEGVASITNRLYVFGKDDMPLPTPGGYIESSSSISAYGLRVGYATFDTVDDPAELLQKANWLFDANNPKRLDYPAVTHKVSMVDLYKLYGDKYKIGLGDSVVIKNEVLGINETKRVVKIEYYPYSPQQSEVTLGYPPATYNDFFERLAQTYTTVKKATIQSSGNIKADYLENIRSKLQTEVNEAAVDALMHDHADLYVDNLNDPQKAILIGKGIFAIANSKKENGDWDWRTIATGDRVVADEVDAAWVYAGALVGNVFKTAETGKRIEITSNCFKIYNAANKLEGMAFGDGVGTNYGDMFFYNPVAGGPSEVAMKIYNTLGDGFVIAPEGSYGLQIGVPNKTVIAVGNWECGGAALKDLNDGLNPYLTANGISGTVTFGDKTITVVDGQITGIT